MSTTTGGLPLMDQTQPQRYLTFNEVAWALDVLQTGVLSRTLTAPPGSPTEGDAYIVDSPATGAWTGKEDKIAFYFGGIWNFLSEELAQGRGIYVDATDEVIRWDGAAYVSASNLASPLITGTADISEALKLSGDISPAQITANADDYNPTGLSTASVLRLSTDASRNLTGIQGGADGRILVLHNVGSFDLVLKDDATSTAGNRFQLNADITIAPNQSTVIQYDSTSSRWRVIGGQGSSGGAVTSVNGASGAVSLNGGYVGVKGADIASAATVDLATATGDWADITGSTGPITSFGTVAAGVKRSLRFTGTPTITHNATSLILQTGANIVAAAGDWLHLRSLGSGNWVSEGYERASGAALAGSGSTQGKHAIWIAAGSITPSATGGCASLATIASAANQPDIQTLDFDPTTQEYAQFSIRMPKSWNEGTVTFSPVWSHAATTTNFGVVWDLQAVAVSDDDAIAVAFGTAQTSTDTGGTTNDAYAGPESSAITVAGTPAAEDLVFFRLSRVTGNGSDTMAIDARLHGVTLYLTTDADTDA